MFFKAFFLNDGESDKLRKFKKRFSIRKKSDHLNHAFVLSIRIKNLITSDAFAHNMIHVASNDGVLALHDASIPLYAPGV